MAKCVLSLLLLLPGALCVPAQVRCEDFLQTPAARPAALPREAVLGETGPVEGLLKLSLSPDGRRIATVGQDGRLRIFDAGTCKQIASYEAHPGGCHDVKFSPAGTAVFTCGADRCVREWNPDTGKQIRVFEGAAGEVKSLACSLDGLYLAGGDNAATINVWDMGTGRRLHGMKGHKAVLPPGVEQEHVCTIDALVFAPNSRMLLSEADDETARLWDALRGVELRALPNHDNRDATLAFSPDGVTAASSRGSELCPYGSVVRLWDVHSGRVMRVLTGMGADAHCVAFSPDGISVFAGSRDRIVHQWDAATGVELRRFRLPGSPLALAVAPDGNSLWSLSGREGLVQWKIDSVPAGAKAPAATDSEAWEKLASADYGERAAGFEHFIKKLPPAESLAALSRLAEAEEDAAPSASRSLIAQLDDDNFGIRLRAFEDMQRMGPAGRIELQAALAHDSPEVRSRAGSLFQSWRIIPGARGVLAAEILFHMATPGARAKLEALTHPPHLCAARAKALLARMAK